MKLVTKRGVKHHKIEVGHLVEFTYQELNKEKSLGLVTKVDRELREITAIWSDTLIESSINYTHDYEPITNVWEVVNF